MKHLPARIRSLFFFVLFSVLFGFLMLSANSPVYANYLGSGQCDEEGGPGPYSVSVSDCQTFGGISPQNTCCQTGGGCTAADGASLILWDWSHATGCTVMADTENPFDVKCDPGSWRYQYQYTQCGATDSCTSAWPYLNSGQCSQSGCSAGGVYKTCCKSDGSGEVNGQCWGGSFSGSCPGGSTTVMCGVSSGTCAAVAPLPCTTASCGEAACSILRRCTATASTEVGLCTDGIDNDCDGLIDCADSDCTPRVDAVTNWSCTGTTPTLSASWSGYDTSCSACNIFVRAGASDYQIGTNCSSNWSGTTLPGGPAVVPGGTYRLFAQDATDTIDGGQVTCPAQALLCPTSAPAGLSDSCGASGQCSPSTGSVTLSWSPVTNADWYDVRVDDGSAGDTADGPVADNCAGSPGHDVCINQFSGTSMTITFKGAKNGKTYTWWVHAGGQDQGQTCSATSATYDNFAIGTTPAPTVSCSGTPSPAASGATVTWTASPSGGSGSFGTNAYFWSGDVSGTTKQVTATYTNTGTSAIMKTAQVTVTDSAGKTSQPASCSVQVNPPALGTNSIDSPATVTRQTGQSWPTITITTNTSSGGKVYIKQGSNTQTGLCSGTLCSGWTQIIPSVSTGTQNNSWNPNSVTINDGTYTFGLFDSSVTRILAIDTTAFSTGSPPPPPVGGGNCNGSLTINGQPASSNPIHGSTSSSFAVAASSSTCYTVSLPWPYESQTLCGSSFSKTLTFSSADTYTISMTNISWGGTCNLSKQIVIQQPGVSCDRPYGTSYVSFYTFSDPAFNAQQWPQYHWVQGATSSDPSCQPDDNSVSLPAQSDLASLQTTSGQAFRATLGQAASKFVTAVLGVFTDKVLGISTSQSNSPKSQVRSVTNPKEDNQKGQVLALVSCDSRQNTTNGSTSPGLNPECNDNNPCTTDYCYPRDDSDGFPYAGIGYCSFQNKPYQTVCGANPHDSAGKAYCGGNWIGDGDGICHAMPSNAANTVDISSVLCKTKEDCADGNSCTQDLCMGYQPAGCDSDGSGCWREQLGKCSRWNGNTNTNQPSAFVCQKDVSSNPIALCDGGSSPYALPTQPGFQLSQCVISYQNCTDVTKNTFDTNGNLVCCGVVNVQGKSCTGDCRLASFPDINVFLGQSTPAGGWNNDSKNYFRPEMGTVEVPQTPLAGVTIHVLDDQCGFSQTAVTDARGRTAFQLIPYIGNKTNKQTLNYRIWADLPTGSQFTRGSDTRQFSGSWFDSYRVATRYFGPGGLPEVYGGWRGYFNSGANTDSWALDYFTFGFKSSSSIAGMVFLDANKNGVKDAGETGYTSGVAVNVAGVSSTTTDGSGNYSFSNLTSGTYTVTLTPPTGYKVTSTNPVSVSTIPATVDFGIVEYTGPWWQTKDGDLWSQGDINSVISQKCVDSAQCVEELSLKGTGGYPGVLVYGGGSASFGKGKSSSKEWVANSGFAGRRYDYSWFTSLAPSEVFTDSRSVIAGSTIDGGDLVSGYESKGYIWRYRNGDLTINGTANLNDRKVILVVNGKLTLKGRITVTDGQGFFMVIGKGDISVDGGVSHPNQPALEGLFVTDGTFSTGTKSPQKDDQLWLRGSIAAWGGVALQRDLGSDNDTKPGEFIEYAPDLLFTFPRDLARQGMNWREVAP